MVHYMLESAFYPKVFLRMDANAGVVNLQYFNPDAGQGSTGPWLRFNLITLPDSNLIIQSRETPTAYLRFHASGVSLDPSVTNGGGKVDAGPLMEESYLHPIALGSHPSTNHVALESVKTPGRFLRFYYSGNNEWNNSGEGLVNGQAYIGEQERFYIRTIND